MKYSGLAIIFILTLLSCKRVNQKNLSIISQKYGTTIDLIDSLKYYAINKDLTQNNIRHSLKIISYINAGCEPCLYELLSWKQLLTEYKDYDVSFLFYIRPQDVDELKKILLDIDFLYPVIVDYENSFYKKNRLDQDKMYQTFLVDANNKIILIGNPIYDANIKDLYTSTIRKIKN